MKNILRYLYSRQLLVVAIIILLSVLIWALINKRVGSRKRCRSVLKYANIIICFIEVAVVLYITVISRTSGEVEVCIIPFYSLVMAKGEPEMYRTMLMNVMLFVPLGLTMPYALRQSCSRKIMHTVLVALLLSTMIEGMQGIFHLGRAEIDDVICNTLGATVGSASYLMSDKMEKISIKKRFGVNHERSN